VTATGWLVGIDDTDNAESIGTGRLARMLAEHLESQELLAATSVTFSGVEVLSARYCSAL
jgi:hypothetical protein